MMGALDPFEQFANVVEAEAGPEAAETACLDAKRSALLGGTSRHQAVPQRLVDDVAKRAPRSAGRCFQPRRDILIKSQRRAHILMLVKRHHDVKGGASTGRSVNRTDSVTEIADALSSASRPCRSTCTCSATVQLLLLEAWGSRWARQHPWRAALLRHRAAIDCLMCRCRSS